VLPDIFDKLNHAIHGNDAKRGNEKKFTAR